jgi:hypothetical protein
MADPLRQTYGEVFFLTSGLQRDPYGLANFHPASNVNRLDIYLEDGVSTNVVMVNFKADGKGYPTSVFFPTLYGGTVQKVITGEVSARSFAKYSLLVPPQVLQWNANGTSTLSLQTTVVQTAGDGLLGAFENYTALTTTYPATEVLMDAGSIAYVYTTVGSDEYGFYAVTYDSVAVTYSWTLVDNPVTQINMVDTKQYNIVGMQIQKGNLPRPTSTVTISDEYIRYILAYIATVNDNCNLNKDTLDDHEIRITALETDVDTIIAGTQDITFNNTISGLVATTLKGAVDEVAIAISNMRDGTTIVKKAEQDKNGNDIVDTYETKSDATSKLALKADKTYVDAQDQALDGRVGDLETANMVKSIAVVGTHLFTLTFYDGTTSNILTLAELKAFIGEATTSLSGLMSATDKTNLNTLMALFDSDGDNVVNTIAEILAIFNAYPEGADLVTVLASKVDKTQKVNGKALSGDIVINAEDIPVTHSGTNYLDASDDVKEDVETLDTQIKANADNIATHETRLDTVEPILYENEKRIDTLEEDLRKTVSGDTEATTNMEVVGHLGKDVANGAMRVGVDGMTLQATNRISLVSGSANGITYTVSGNQITLSGTASAETTLTLSSGLTATNKAYINYDYVSGTSSGTITLKNDATSLHAIYNSDYSGVVTLGTTTITLVIANGAVLSSLIIKYHNYGVTTLISNKQYSPLFNTTFDLMSDANIKTQMDAWVTRGELPNDNIQSVSGNKRYKAVGVNLFDKSQYATSYAYKIKVKPSTAYVWSASTAYKTYDKDLNELVSATGTTVTTGSTAVYIAFSGVANVDTFQLEQGSTATTYQSFTDTELYLQSNQNLFRVPNGVKDTIEFRNGKYYYVQRVKKYTLQFSDIVTLVTSGINTDYVGIPLSKFIPSVSAQGISTADGSFIVDNFYGELANEAIDSSVDNFGKIKTTDSSLFLIVAKGTYASLAEAQADLAGTVIYYQLAIPIETEISSIGQLLGGSRYTVYMDDNIIAPQATTYTTNATIEDSDYPISALDTIIKINTDGSQTKLSTSNATIAGDGLSFTHTSLTSGDIVIFTYYYANANSVVGNSVIYYYNAEDDLRFPVTALPFPASGRPDFDTTNIGLLFPQNNTTEAVYIVAQMPHDRVTDSDILPHVHCRLSGAGQPVMKIDYKWFNASATAIPTSFTTYTMNVNTATWSSGTISNMIYGSAPISGVGKGRSSILIMKLYRDDNVYSGDLLVDEFDIHYYKVK